MRVSLLFGLHILQPTSLVAHAPSYSPKWNITVSCSLYRAKMTTKIKECAWVLNLFLTGSSLWISMHLSHIDIWKGNLAPELWWGAPFVLPKPNQEIQACKWLDMVVSYDPWKQLDWGVTTEAPSPRTALSAMSGTGNQDGRPMALPRCSHISPILTGFGAVALMTPITNNHHPEFTSRQSLSYGQRLHVIF